MFWEVFPCDGYSSMKRVGLIDNLSNIPTYRETGFFEGNAESLLAATGGNTGNVAFVYGIGKILANPISRIGWGWTPSVVRERVDHIVVACANQIGAHADLSDWAKFLEKFDLPVTLIGLGAQAEKAEDEVKIPDGSKKFLEVVAALRGEGVQNIGVRGVFTQGVLSKNGTDSKITGCPSLMISSNKALGQTILDNQNKNGTKKVAVAAGNLWHGPSAFLEKLMADIVDSYSGAYILQHPLEMAQLALGEREAISETAIKRFLEVYQPKFKDADELFEWYRKNAYLFVDVPNWRSFLRHFDLVVGPRYHGVAIGVQSEVPSCAITMDARTEELCSQTGVKFIKMSSISKDMKPEDLIELSQWTRSDAEKLDAIRVQAAGVFVEFLEDNGLVPSSHLKSFMIA